mmetsp:Transcript_3787/g.14037  ORF Transcript_3787/g.14037 Transcript_3787/m.14037 type:complete len:286 (+) Transcript_3787:922-1779(+)
MRRLTLCRSPNSLMSIRTMWRSSSNSSAASVLASSVLPTPVGPRKRKLPVGCPPRDMPARARSTALATAVTAAGCATTRSASLSASLSSFVRSLVVSLETGMPVHRATTSAISWSPTTSVDSGPASSPPPPAPAAAPRRSSSSLSSSATRWRWRASRSGSAPYRRSATRAASRMRSASAILCCTSAIFCLTCRTSSTRARSMSCRARSGASSSAILLSSFFTFSSRSRLPLSFSFASALASTSSCSWRRSSWSMASGCESSATRTCAHASSTRSMALSGRKRCVM